MSLHLPPLLSNRLAVLVSPHGRRGGLLGHGEQVAATTATAPLRSVDGLPRSGELGILFVSVVGSRAYGLHTDTSDVDYRGCFVAGSDIQFGLDGPPAQLVHDGDQLCLWEIEKLIRLALAANPTVLEAFYSPQLVWQNSAIKADFERLRGAGTFLSRRVVDTFLGYSDAQFKKMQRSRERGTRFKWQHAMHMIRLLQSGLRLIETGRFDVVVRAAERGDLLAIRAGEVAWESVDQLRRVLSQKFRDAVNTSPLPLEPDRAAAESFLIGLRQRIAQRPFHD